MLGEPKAFLAFPSRDEVSSTLAKQIADVARRRGFDVLEPWRMSGEGEPAWRIHKAIRSADVVIADVTGTTANVATGTNAHGARENVAFEVGLAMGLGKRVLLLSRQRLDALPSDLQGYQIAVYRPDELETVNRYIDLWLRDEAEERSSSSR
jgi:nucleoside 2-deoxyribosyltransferase